LGKRNRHKSKQNRKFLACTFKYNGIVKRIITDVGATPAFDPKDYEKALPYEIIDFRALWDTGATDSVITANTVQELGLVPTGSTKVNHAGGVDIVNTYLINLFLPNMIALPHVLVSECQSSDFDVIIGMNVINEGDLSITNLNSSTWMSFRIPSIRGIDYVDEYNKLNQVT